MGKAKYYDPNTEDLHVPDLEAEADCDEVGLIRAITVKARSSLQRKELFKSIQEEDHKPPLQLLLDMKVRWGSTHSMLLRAESRKDQVDSFVFKLSTAKDMNAEAQKKMRGLTLSDDEWTQVRLFNNLLQFADAAQHAFSAASRPTLHNALPAIEKLYAEWKKALSKL
ncbi:hypothetical protein B0H34DRAFT_803273 [Crassisporium funariophilum]|nr:hypothetical protein B0H34DRAFT_803273 [Crassisporium funariophilum]